MTSIKHLDLSNHKIWKDKNIKPEDKEIYAYLYSEAFDKLVTHINIGDIQNKIHITNVGFKNNFFYLLLLGTKSKYSSNSTLKALIFLKYLTYKSPLITL